MLKDNTIEKSRFKIVPKCWLQFYQINDHIYPYVIHSYRNYLQIYIFTSYIIYRYLVVLMVKNLPANAGDLRDIGSIPRPGRCPGGGTHSSILAWRIPWIEETGRLQVTVRQTQWSDLAHIHACCYECRSYKHYLHVSKSMIFKFFIYF